jgi:hypothetical protein
LFIEYIVAEIIGLNRIDLSAPAPFVARTTAASGNEGLIGAKFVAQVIHVVPLAEP